jgi:hypothetical protein
MAAAEPHVHVGTMLTALDTTAPQVFYSQKEEVEAMGLASTVPVRYLPPELTVDPNHPACKSSARAEELDRYWGFGSGWSHYVTLAWRQVMNIDSFGYYVTLVPALLLLPLLLLLPYFWSKEGRWLRLLTVGTFIFFVQWAFAANGVPWYGIGMFLGFAIGLEAFIVYAPDKPNRYIFGFLIAMSIMICITNRLWPVSSGCLVISIKKLSDSAVLKIFWYLRTNSLAKSKFLLRTAVEISLLQEAAIQINPSEYFSSRSKSILGL